MSFPSETMRSWVDVDLAALLDNARTVASVSKSRLLPMVKANGYGLGALQVVRALERIDPWGYGIAFSEEAAELRKAGIRRPLLVTTPLLPEWIGRYLELDLRPCIGDPAALNAWITRSGQPFHLEIDTGMSRGGIRWDDRASLEAVRDMLARAPGWEGVFTHFVSAESDPEMTALQWTRFQEIVSSLPRRPALTHAANSAAALAGQTYAGDLVRPGIFLYGGEAGARPPRPVAALRGQVVALRSIQTSDPVGYNATWRAHRPTLIATISVGYADGLPRSGAQPISDHSRQLELGGRLVPIVGRVTMDMCMVAVDGHVAIGEIATVYGGLISIDQQAAMAGTVSYELLTRLGNRVSRCYQGLE